MNAPMQKRTMSGTQDYSKDVEEIKAWAVAEMNEYWTLAPITAEQRKAAQSNFDAMKAKVLAHTDPMWWQEQVRLCDSRTTHPGALWLKAGAK